VRCGAQRLVVAVAVASGSSARSSQRGGSFGRAFAALRSLNLVLSSVLNQRVQAVLAAAATALAARHAKTAQDKQRTERGK